MIDMNLDTRYATENQYYIKQTLAVAGPGEAIRIKGGDIQNIAYQLEGEGSVQVTAYPYADIEAGTAIWSTLTDGDTVNPAISAIRQNNTSGTTVFCVRAQ
jgi:hypothetical protein